jgi:hypothetical protein
MKSPFELVEYSLVAVAKNHNPTILNPDFLKRNKIVPEGWKIERPLCTDVLSQVVFENGFVIIVEPQRLLFVEKNPERSPSVPTVAEIAVNYIETLPHATYTAIGVNFKCRIPFRSQKESELYVLDRMISPGPWKELCDGLRSAALKFIYDVEDAKLVLSVEPAIYQRPDKPVEFILGISANFHRDLPEEHNEAIVHMKSVMTNWENDRESLDKIIAKIFEEGE